MEDSSWRSPLPSYDYSSGNPSLDRFQCSVMPDSHSYGSASDMNNISTELTSSNDFSGEKSSRESFCLASCYSVVINTNSLLFLLVLSVVSGLVLFITNTIYNTKLAAMK